MKIAGITTRLRALRSISTTKKRSSLMQKKFSFFRTFACVLLLSFSTTLIPVAVLAETAPASAPAVNTSVATADKVDLSYLSEPAPNHAGEKQERILLASQDKTDMQAAGSAQKSSCHDCYGGFWEIHFGGYRWAWWALAGTALIAIHAGAD
jgi:hypothetical protein